MGFDQRTMSMSCKSNALQLCPSAICKRFDIGGEDAIHYLVFRNKEDADNRNGHLRISAARSAKDAWGYALANLIQQVKDKGLKSVNPLDTL